MLNFSLVQNVKVLADFGAACAYGFPAMIKSFVPIFTILIWINRVI